MVPAKVNENKMNECDENSKLQTKIVVCDPMHIKFKNLHIYDVAHNLNMAIYSNIGNIAIFEGIHYKLGERDL